MITRLRVAILLTLALSAGVMIGATYRENYRIHGYVFVNAVQHSGIGVDTARTSDSSIALVVYDPKDKQKIATYIYYNFPHYGSHTGKIFEVLGGERKFEVEIK